MKPNRFSRRIADVLSLLTSFAITLGVTLNADAAPNQSHKLRVHDPALASSLIAKGGKLLADYGAFQLIETEDVSAAKADGAQPADESDFIQLNATQLDTRAPEVKALRKAAGTFAGKRLHLVQFVGPVKPEWHDALEATGVRLVHYIPQNAYLVQGDTTALAKLQAWAGSSGYVQWEGTYADDYKIHPRARTTDAKGRAQTIATDTFAVQLLDDADANPATLALIEQLKLEPVKRQFRALHYLNVIVRLPPGRLAEIAARPEVISIQPYFDRRKFCERQDQIIAGNLSGNIPIGPGYLAWLAGKGFTQTHFDASGFVVDVSDSGIDNGSTIPNHFGLYKTGNTSSSSRVGYNRLEGSPNAGSTLQGCDGHGNLNSHIIGGYDDLSGFPFADGSGYHYGLGVCPFVKVGSSVIFDPNKFTNPSYNDLQSRAYRDGARVSNNSWGADTAGAYDVDAQNYDALVRDAQPAGSAVATAGNQQMVICFAAGNAGPGAQTVGSPGTAKNIISVGAGENVQAFGGADGSGISDIGADSANDIISFSSRGPCADGRNKPDLCAPGTHVSGGVPQASSPSSTGTHLACYNGSGVSGGVNSIYFPSSGQEFYTASSGTSHSTPAVAGACALVRQYFINNALTPPSPAMTKAFLINSARYMTGVSANDTLPSNNQGMGEVNLGVAFDGVRRVLRDQLGADKFTATGQVRSFTNTITDPSKPFRVTLAWTDAPGSTSGNAYNNDLDLTVTVGGSTYKGNVFSGANSVTGGTADGKNNMESVFLPAGVSGSFVVTVTAANINSDGVPNEAPSLDQDFALVIYNGEQAAGPVISADSFTVTAESCSPPNGAIDPNETVTVGFALRNVGTANTTNLVATLQAAGGVSPVSGPQTYGALVAGSGAVTQSFSFTASGACGATLSAMLTLTDGATNLGAVTFNIPMGQLGPIFSQNFDGAAAPALPGGWTTSQSGSQSLWVTSTAQRDTLPNAAFATDAGSIGVNELVSPVVAISSDLAQLTFRHYYNTESGWDGGVLEIKIGGGAFADILSAGGSFVAGGYNLTLGSSGNPLTGRQAWSGNSGGFITTTVNLPASAAGQNVQFKWRCGSDDSVSGAGWYVDSVAVNARICCGGASVALPNMMADTSSIAAEGCVTNNGAIDPGETVTVNFGLKNVGTASTTNLVATLLATNGVLAPGAPQTYGAVTAGGATVSRPFTFTAGGACGDAITPTLQLQDGATDLGTVMFVFQLGVASSVFSENFDSVTAPALPGGWTTSQSGSQSNWKTDKTTPDTAPNAAFSTDPAAAGVNELDTPLIVLPAGTALLSFRNNYNLEAGSGNTGYDTGVLEIKIGAGAWTDILAAGGSFVSGGYDHTTSSSYGNPLGGRQGWSGSSSGFVTTVVSLPAAAAGQTIQLRWRCGSDSSVGGVGWFIDTILVTARKCCSEPLTIVTPPHNQAVLAGETATFGVTASGMPPLNYQWRFYGTNLVGATATNFTRVNVQPPDTGIYSVVVTNLSGSITSAPALLSIVNRPTLLNPRETTNGLFVFEVSGDAGFNYQIERVTNATASNWLSAGVVSNATGQVSFSETNSTDSLRIYRARLLP